MSEPLKWGLLILAGATAGFVNMIAGGGSMLTLPALLFIGLPAPVANATNRVSILLQNATGVVQFHRAEKLNWLELLPILPALLLGAILGAFSTITVPRAAFDIILGVVLIIMSIVLLFRPSLLTHTRPVETPMWLQIPIFFFIGLYGGFIQAGVGLLLIPALVLMRGEDIVSTNALKVAIILATSLLSLIIFSLVSTVIWGYGLALAIGSMGGAILGVRFALRRGMVAIRWILAAVVVATALRLFGML